MIDRNFNYLLVGGGLILIGLLVLFVMIGEW